MLNMLMIGGYFGEAKRRTSGYIDKLFSEFIEINNYYPLFEIENINGGLRSSLEEYLSCVDQYDIVVWFVDIDNDADKLLPKIKQINSKCILVSSKNNSDSKYNYLDLIGRALDSKSNLLVEFTGPKTNTEATILDPLGNAFQYRCKSIKTVAYTLYQRLSILSKFTRISSASLEKELPIPEDKEFFTIIQNNAGQFHDLVHAVHQDRFIGNASFRCESGFPSMRHDDIIYVSRRNVDKRNIGTNSFVPVKLELDSKNPVVQYYGYKKPSVDTPVQIMLYKHFPKMRYCLHQHVYIENAVTTKHIVPCGAIEEFEEIRNELYRDRDMINATDLKYFSINLKGHGSLIMADDLDYFKSIQYYARPLPENYVA